MKDVTLASWIVASLAFLALIAWFFLIYDNSGKAMYTTDFTKPEVDFINNSNYQMPILTVDDSSQMEILRRPSKQLSKAAISSDTYKKLVAYMTSTILASDYKMNGLSAPQIGINRRLVVARRLDKPGEPLEPYVNIKLDSLYGKRIYYNLGDCASFPYRRFRVWYYEYIVISYTDPLTFQTINETFTGLEAEIFEHLIDHLDGILFIDKAESSFVDANKKSVYDSAKNVKVSNPHIILKTDNDNRRK